MGACDLEQSWNGDMELDLCIEKASGTYYDVALEPGRVAAKGSIGRGVQENQDERHGVGEMEWDTWPACPLANKAHRPTCSAFYPYGLWFAWILVEYKGVGSDIEAESACRACPAGCLSHASLQITQGLSGACSVLWQKTRANCGLPELGLATMRCHGTFKLPAGISLPASQDAHIVLS